jgi:hypothetical protein
LFSTVLYTARCRFVLCHIMQEWMDQYCPSLRLHVANNFLSPSFSCKSAEPGTRYLQKVLREIYVAFTECALKDPFYELEMPIRCELFTQTVNDVMSRYDDR